MFPISSVEKMARLYAATWTLLTLGASSMMLDLRGHLRDAGEQAPVTHLNSEHFWTTRGGDPFGSRSSRFVGPTNFSAGPTWQWNNELDEQVRHSPLIDAGKNVYITTATRVRKFSSDGEILWTHTLGPTDGKITDSPALYKSGIYFFSATDDNTSVFSLSLADGGIIWRNDMDVKHSFDAHSMSAFNDTLLMGAMDHPADGMTDGNNIVLALSATDGKKLWHYAPGDVLWNFAPSTPGDGTILFATNCGAVHRISWEGNLIWKAGRPNPGYWCSTGGGSLGENGVFYNEYNYGSVKAVIDARRVSDGELLWSREFEEGYGGWQYPSIGRVGKDGVLAVVAAIGGITDFPHFPPLPEQATEPIASQFAHYVEYLSNSSLRNEWGVPKLPNALVAMDAATGEVLWRFEERAWDHYGAKGDEATIVPRTLRNVVDPQSDLICLPDIQGIPLISGDGFVYASSSHGGQLRSMRDENQDGTITPDEVSTFATHNCFLNAPSLAPGMLVAAPCWGPVYVFQSV